MEQREGEFEECGEREREVKTGRRGQRRRERGRVGRREEEVRENTKSLTTAVAKARPSTYDVPLPSSSISTRDRGVASSSKRAVSVISTLRKKTNK